MCMLVSLKYRISIYTHTVSDRTKSLQTFQDWQHARLSRELVWWRACSFKTCKTRIPRRQPGSRQLWGACSTSLLGCFTCTEAICSSVGMGGVTRAAAHGTVGAHQTAAWASSAGPHWRVFSIILVCQPAKGCTPSCCAWEEHVTLGEKEISVFQRL